MERTAKIRRSGAYGVAGVIVLVASGFLPMSTPRWYVYAVFALVCLFAGLALYFNAQERRAGLTKRTAGFFTLAILVILLALCWLLPLVL
jgi:hypothetical protein